MKAVLLPIFCFMLLTNKSLAQKSNTSVADLQRYLTKHIHYPALAAENDVQGICYLSFKLDKNKFITDIKILKQLQLCCDEEVKRALQDYVGFPLIKPGEYSISVRFAFNRTGIKEDPTIVTEAKSKLKNYLFNVDVIRYYLPIKRTVTDSPGVIIHN